MPLPGLFTPGKDPLPIVQEVGWAPEPVWTGAKNLAPTEIRSPDSPARSKSLYRLRYPGPPGPVIPSINRENDATIKQALKSRHCVQAEICSRDPNSQSANHWICYVGAQLVCAHSRSLRADERVIATEQIMGWHARP